MKQLYQHIKDIQNTKYKRHSLKDTFHKVKRSSRKTYPTNTVCRFHWLFRIQIGKFSIQTWRHISHNFTDMVHNLSKKCCSINLKDTKEWYHRKEKCWSCTQFDFHKFGRYCSQKCNLAGIENKMSNLCNKYNLAGRARRLILLLDFSK